MIDLIRTRAERFYADQPDAAGIVCLADSRDEAAFAPAGDAQPRWIVTSPPYYGMRTYLPDQWLRNWFLGGESRVEYSNARQLGHQSPAAYADQLDTVWKNVASVATMDAQLIVRFGGIADRKADPLSIVKSSVKESGWKIATVKPAGSAASGKRQSLHFGRTPTAARDEYDVWARRA